MGECSEKTRGAMEDDFRTNLIRKRKKMKMYFEDATDEENSVASAASVTCGCGCPDSDDEGDSNDVAEKSAGSPDLENVDFRSEELDCKEIRPSSVHDSFSITASPTSELCGEYSEQVSMESSTASKEKLTSPTVSSRRQAQKIMPTAEEIDEFFAASEKYEQKRFAEKYNYDIVNDVPLQGKYQWFRVHP